MHKIFIAPLTKMIEVEDGANLRESLIKENVDITSPCGGCASCGRCVVVIKNGDDKLSEISFEEKQILGNVFHITKERLSCQTRVHGDIEIDITLHVAEKAAKKTIVRKTKETLAVEKEERRLNSADVEVAVKEGGFRKPKTFNYSEED